MMKALSDSLWRIYQRSELPQAWYKGGNLPWNEPGFSERMLLEHLDESHGAASRQVSEREQQVDWLWEKLDLKPGSTVLDVTCGPGLYAVALASRGCAVTGIDFSPASIKYARALAHEKGVSELCTFIEQDVRTMDFSAALPNTKYDAALFIYGQLAVFPIDEAEELLSKIAGRLVPGGTICIELLNKERIDKNNSNWWFTDEKGLWGDEPFLHLGERFWIEEQGLSIERFYTVELSTGKMTEITLCDQSYGTEDVVAKLNRCGFANVDVYHAWDGLTLSDADEWVVYLAKTRGSPGL